MTIMICRFPPFEAKEVRKQNLTVEAIL